MHPIQSRILRELMFHACRRYSDLKPAEVDPALFMYHFRKLLGMEMVAKTEDGYVLTPEGMRQASRTSTETLSLRMQPTICNFIACQNEAGEWLLHTRAYHPFLGLKSFPYGKLHWGESLKEAAGREMLDKTGLQVELALWGNLYLRVFEGPKLIAHMLCHIFKGIKWQGELLAENPKGSCVWERIDNPEASGFLPGFAGIFSIASGKAKPGDIGELAIKVPNRYPWPEQTEEEGSGLIEW